GDAVLVPREFLEPNIGSDGLRNLPAARESRTESQGPERSSSNLCRSVGFGQVVLIEVVRRRQSGFSQADQPDNHLVQIDIVSRGHGDIERAKELSVTRTRKRYQ